MSTSTLSLSRRRSLVLSRAADYVELAKPRIAVLVLVAVAVAAYVAAWGHVEVALLAHALGGTLLVAASASACNQWLEQDRDALMKRTHARPLPAGRLSAWEVAGFAAVTLAAGLIDLTVAVNLPAALWAAATWVAYVVVYTPLKTRSASNTAVGAIAGALPVLIGWSAVGAPLGVRSLALFLIVYLWQFPHFMAIAWLYREQYARAGMQMLPVVDPSGRRAAVQAILGAAALLPMGLLLAALLPPPAGLAFGAGSLGLALVQLAAAWKFFLRRDDASARRLLRASLIYLPGLLALAAAVVAVCL